MQQALKMRIIFIYIFFTFSLSCATYQQSKTMVKRDRFGESPVVDMRSGESALEHYIKEERIEKKRQAYHQDLTRDQAQ
ncbi:MAG: hypothetical protein KBD78_12770 [Oligoflexales bacterium]|nr:hypothetical protein [Oligoflexales bacterium]